MRYLPFHSLHLLIPALWFVGTTFVAAHDSYAATREATNKWLASLNDTEKAKASFPFSDSERKNWHFIPRQRKGLPLKEMSAAQRLLAWEMLKAAMSEGGISKVEAVMGLEAVLRETETGRSNGPTRDPDLYFLSVFGSPSDATWGWRWEGHHLSLNFTTANKSVMALTPSFFGSNPGEVRNGPANKKGLRALGEEEDLGRRIVKSLNEAQRKKAVILTEAPKEIMNLPGRADTKPEGLPASEMTPEQRDLVAQLLKLFVYKYRDDVADAEWKRLEAKGSEALYFAWAGGLERGEKHYYRVQAGNFVVEYDNTQNDANHVHAVWRDFDRDFGNDLLREHLATDHAP
jgi:hypothetical protein